MAADAYGLLRFRTSNLGDEIQALAARQFLPRVDRYVDRDELSRDPGGREHTRLIMNGWYMARPEMWPPHPKILPLPISIHISQHRPSRWRLWTARPSRTMLGRDGLNWLRQHGPIGARDRATEILLSAHGVEAYYSGCLTLTIAPLRRAERTGRVVACDLPQDAVAALARRTREPPILTSHIDTATQGVKARMAQAERRLDLYAGAKAVVTSRLHCALPCLALGTPVLFIPILRDPYRQEPGMELAHHCGLEDFVAGRVAFDPEDPPANLEAYRPLAAALAERVRRFIAVDAARTLANCPAWRLPHRQPHD